MIKFCDFSKAASVYNDYNITKIIVFLSVDTMADCAMYKALSQKYSDLDSKFADAISNKTCRPGDYIRVQVASGHTIFFLVVRAIEKFQPYLLDILKAIDRVVPVIKRENPDGLSPSNVLFPMPAADELKLSDTIFIPAICDRLNDKAINVYILSNGDHEHYIEKIEDDIIYYKRDSWKSDWMLNLDDILMVTIIAYVLTLCHDFKISKTNLIKCYQVCHQNGMFPKIEWYQTEWGPFFKMFLPKSNSLINNGLLMNTYHYSNAEPKKFSCIIGPMFPHIRYLAFTQLANKQELIVKIANEIKMEHIKSYQNKPENTQKYQPKNNDNDSSTFAL